MKAPDRPASALSDLKAGIERIIYEWEASDGLYSDAAAAVVAYVLRFPRLLEAQHELDDSAR